MPLEFTSAATVKTWPGSKSTAANEFCETVGID
jgi:hypothetical protein